MTGTSADRYKKRRECDFMKKRLVFTAAFVIAAALAAGCQNGQTSASGASKTGAPQTAEGTQAQDAGEDAEAELLRTVKTTQYFTDEPVAAEDIEKILEAGVNAPSAMNTQPWHFTAITDGEVLEQLAADMETAMKNAGGAPGGMHGGGPGKPGGPGRPGGPGKPGVPGAPEDPGKPAPEGAEKPELPEGTEKPELPEGAERTELPEGAEPPEAPQGAEIPEGADIPETATPSGPEESSEGGPAKAGIADAPLAIVVSCQAGSELDAGLACQNMAAEAQLLGYGTKILTSPTMVLNGQERETYRELLDIPEDQAAAAVLLIGKEDTSLSEETDGVTGPSVRSAYEDMVTLLTGSDAGGSTNDAE